MPSLKELKNLIPLLREPSEQEKLDAINEKIGMTGPMRSRPTADLAYRADKILREDQDKEPIQGLKDMWEYSDTIQPELFNRVIEKRRRGEDEEFNKEIELFKQKVKEEAAKKQALGNSKFKKTKNLLKK